MFYSPKHARIDKASPARRRIAGVAVAGASVAVGSMATAQSASASTGASSSVWDRVAACESGGNWSISTGNGFYGGLQFTSQTWQGFGGGKYAASANQASKSQQIEIAQKVLQVQGPGAWPVCSQKAGLTKANGSGSVAPAPAPKAAPQQQAPQQQAPQQQASRSEARTSAADGALVVDGIRGPKTNAAIEQWVGVSQDGALSAADVQALQGKVGTAQDGIIGSVTTTAVQQLVGAAEDGIWGPETTSKLQTYLNAH